MTQEISRHAAIPGECSGRRLDAVVADLFPEFSRGQLQNWIKSGDLTLNGECKKPNTKVIGGEAVSLAAALTDVNNWQPEAIDFDVVFEDKHICVINKPAGLVVHPAAGNYPGTLLNGLLNRYPDSAHLPRGGIVHRLDKDTTGLMVVAKTLQAQNNMVQQLQARTVSRRYYAAVVGIPLTGGTVDAPIGRDPKHRTRMAVLEGSSNSSNVKEAVTHFEVVERFDGFSLLKLKLETGRTHQIRVHMAHLGYGLIGDTTYKGRPYKTRDLSAELNAYLKAFDRQALHAAELGLVHPDSGKYCEWFSELPTDFAELLTELRQSTAG